MDDYSIGTQPFGMIMDDFDLGDLSAAEVMSGGRPQHIFTFREVQLAEKRVRESGALDLLEQWRLEDITPAGPGGRTRVVSNRAVLTALLLLATRRGALYITTTGDVLRNFDDQQRALLDLPNCASDQKPSKTGPVKRWQDNTHSTFDAMRDLMDPFPQERKNAKSYAEIQTILREHDRAREDLMRERLNQFTRSFMHMTFMAQPRALRRMSKKLDISLDQTFIEPPHKKGYSRKKLAQRVAEEAAKQAGERTPGPTDAFAGWYPKKGDHPDLPKGTKDNFGPEDEGKNGLTEFSWGWTANIAVRVDSEHVDGVSRFPHLAMSATLSMPNVGVAEEAVTLMRNSLIDDLPPGIVDADKAYFANALVERLHQPTHNIGFMPSTDYRVDRLGIQEGAKNIGKRKGASHIKEDSTQKEAISDAGGAVLVEGSHYCPATPKPLLNATKDLVNDVIDKETFYARAAERTQFLIRPKENWDDKGRAPHMCPAAGNSPTVTCPIREMAKKAVDKPRPHVSEDDLPDFLNKICTQHSVSINQADGMRQRQAFHYKSKEWETFHRHARNSIESLNGGVKDKGAECLQIAARRRARGFAAAQMLITMQLTNYNLYKIAQFLLDQFTDARRAAAGKTPVTPIMRRRDREHHNAYTGSYPPGFTPERHVVTQT